MTNVGSEDRLDRLDRFHNPNAWIFQKKINNLRSAGTIYLTYLTYHIHRKWV